MINLKQLLTENTVASKPKLTEADHVQNGLQKVFAGGDVEISYRRCENVGLGYIKNISEAVKIAIQESRKTAKMFGYRDDESRSMFIKEDNDFGKLDAQSPESVMAKTTPEEQPHDETNIDEPEEKREVQIGKEIIRLVGIVSQYLNNPNAPNSSTLEKIRELGDELVKIHGDK